MHLGPDAIQQILFPNDHILNPNRICSNIDVALSAITKFNKFATKITVQQLGHHIVFIAFLQWER